MNKLRSLILLLLVVPIFGCTHHLQVKNINDYQPSSFVTLSNDLSIGIVTQNNNSNGKVLVTGTARALSTYVGNIVYPYRPNHSKQVDVTTKITIRPDHKVVVLCCM